jgi:hypothetical protein
MSTPLIKEGNKYLNSSDIMLLVMDSERVYCEASESANNNSSSLEFDGLKWFIFRSNQVLYSNWIVNTANEIMTYSIEFVPYSNMKNDSLFSCCTLLNNEIVKCQKIYLLEDPSKNHHQEKKVDLINITFLLGISFLYVYLSL